MTIQKQRSNFVTYLLQPLVTYKTAFYFIQFLFFFFLKFSLYSKMKGKLVKIDPHVFCFFLTLIVWQMIVQCLFLHNNYSLKKISFFQFKVAMLSLENVLIYIAQYKHLSAIVDQKLSSLQELLLCKTLNHFKPQLGIFDQKMLRGILEFTRRYYFCSIQALQSHRQIALYLLYIALCSVTRLGRPILKKLGIQLYYYHKNLDKINTTFLGIIDIILMFLLLTLNIFQSFFQCFYSRL